MDYYFDLYELTNACRIRFATCKLKYATQDYWTIVERQLERIYTRLIKT